MKIAFITDGGLEMGVGHIYRCLTIGDELRGVGDIVFLTKSNTIVVNQIADAGFNVIRLDSDNKLPGALEGAKPDIVIIDRLNVEQDFAEKLKNTLNTRLVVFENLSTANRYADVVVNAILGSGFRNRTLWDENKHTLYFYGPRYLVLRKEFYEYNRKRKKAADKVARIVLIFGASDPSNLTSTALKELLTMTNDFKIDVIVGAHFVYFDELNSVLIQHQDRKENVNIYKNAKNVSELMYKADLVISAPGLSVFEALCVGTPVIAIHQSLFQKHGFEGFARTLDKTEMNSLGGMISNADFINPHDEHIARLDIGEGKEEVLRAIAGGQ